MVLFAGKRRGGHDLAADAEGEGRSGWLTLPSTRGRKKRQELLRCEGTLSEKGKTLEPVPFQRGKNPVARRSWKKKGIKQQKLRLFPAGQRKSQRHRSGQREKEPYPLKEKKECVSGERERGAPIFVVAGRKREPTRDRKKAAPLPWSRREESFGAAAEKKKEDRPSSSSPPPYLRRAPLLRKKKNVRPS